MRSKLVISSNIFKLLKLNHWIHWIVRQSFDSLKYQTKRGYKGLKTKTSGDNWPVVFFFEKLWKPRDNFVGFRALKPR